MNKTRAKILIALVASPILLLLIAISVLLIGQFLAYFQQGADPASVFRGNQLIIPSDEEASWLSTAPISGFAPSKAQQDELIAAYWDAWQALSRAHQTGLIEDLSTYWALPALAHAEGAIDAGNFQSYRTRNHQLQLRFFSDDQSIASVEDSFILEQNRVTLYVHATVTLSLDNGRWRIRLIRMNFSQRLLNFP